MKKLILILVSIAVLTGVVSAIVVAALPDSTADNEMAVNPIGNKQSHGTHGNGDVNQKFLNPIWGDDPCDPWSCPPGNDIP